ncbi:MAG: acyl carrier protein [Candidatus Competibacterales bacterium]
MVPGEPALAVARRLVCQTLSIPWERLPLAADTPLLGAVAELDSVSVVALLEAIEAHNGQPLDEGAIDAETFATLGTLAALIGVPGGAE